jgi:hypothetical protein
VIPAAPLHLAVLTVSCLPVSSHCRATPRAARPVCSSLAALSPVLPSLRDSLRSAPPPSGTRHEQKEEPPAAHPQGGAIDLTGLSREALETYAHIVAEQDQLLTTLAEAIPETKPTQPA